MKPKSPQYPITTDLPPEPEQSAKPSPGLYNGPSWKLRHEVREPLESAETAYRRAYPQFFSQPRSARARRRFARRGE